MTNKIILYSYIVIKAKNFHIKYKKNDGKKQIISIFNNKFTNNFSAYIFLYKLLLLFS